MGQFGPIWTLIGPIGPPRGPNIGLLSMSDLLVPIEMLKKHILKWFVKNPSGLSKIPHIGKRSIEKEYLQANTFELVTRRVSRVKMTTAEMGS